MASGFDLEHSLLVEPFVFEDHHNFVLDAWLQSMRRTRFARGGDKDLFYGTQQKLIEAIIERCRCDIAYVEIRDSKAFVGFIVWEPTCLHYVYVKHAYRRIGVATKLIGGIGVPERYSCIFDGRWKKQFIEDKCGMVFDFYAALRYLAGGHEQKRPFQFGS